MPKETDVVHKQVVMETFSQDSEYWRSVYEDVGEEQKVEGLIQGGILRNRELIDRKHAVVELIDRYAGQRKVLALDLGCGTGMTMKDILKRGHAVIGVDMAAGMLNQAQATVSQFVSDGTRCILGDVEDVPFKDGSFDVVVCMGVLQYLQTDRKAIEEMSRVVRDGGLVITTLPNYFRMNNVLDPYYYLVKAVQFVVHNIPLRQPRRADAFSSADFISNRTFANRRYYYGQLSPLFERNHLRRVNIRGIGFGPLTFWRRPLLPVSFSMRVSRFIQGVALKRYFSFLNVFANRWVICLIKGKTERKDSLLHVRAVETG